MRYAAANCTRSPSDLWCVLSVIVRPSLKARTGHYAYAAEAYESHAARAGSCPILEYREAADAPAEPAVGNVAAAAGLPPGTRDAAQTRSAPAVEPPAAAGAWGAAPCRDGATPGAPPPPMPLPDAGGAQHLPPRGPPSGAQGAGVGGSDLARLSMASSGMGDDEVDPEYVCAICLVRLWACACAWRRWA